MEPRTVSGLGLFADCMLRTIHNQTEGLYQ